jgi:F420-dependent oxidoreductase-like protein
MRFTFWPGSSHPYTELLSLAEHVESTGWDRLYICDHFMPNGADVSAPWHECWTLLSALAAAVPRIGIGSIVLGNTYRHPAVLAKMAATLDHVSGGRAVLGLGAGWQENEHTAYGIPFHTLPERLARLGEACELIRALFEQERATFTGKYYELKSAPLEPKPIQRPLPILVGGGGEKVTLRIAARFADEWNVWGDPATLRDKNEILNRHCEKVGRDSQRIQRSAVALLFLSEDKALLERVKGGGRPVIAGGASEVRDTIGAYADAGVHEIVIPDFNLGNPERKRATLDRFIEEVAPAFR